ncbi:MAG: hypothetical protein ACOC1F_05060 [Myxococcota bacterium]
MGICLEPGLRGKYDADHAAGRDRLPALRAGEPIGRACAVKTLVSIRDTGQFMDPRSWSAQGCGGAGGRSMTQLPPSRCCPLEHIQGGRAGGGPALVCTRAVPFHCNGGVHWGDEGGNEPGSGIWPGCLPGSVMGVVGGVATLFVILQSSPA